MSTDPGELGTSTAPAASTPAQAGGAAPRTDQPTTAKPPPTSYEARRAAQDAHNRERAAGGVRRDEPAPAASPAPATTAAVDGERRVKVGDGEYLETELRAAIEHKAASDAHARNRPADANGYRVELPADFKAMPGLEFAVNDPIRGPILQEAREFAHKAGLTQDQFSGMLALRAAEQGHEQRIIQQAIDAENTKLGVNATARVEHVRAWLGAMAGPKVRALNRVLEVAPIADTVEALETLMQKFHALGTAPRDTGRDRASGSIPGFATMTFEQRRAAQDARRVAAR